MSEPTPQQLAKAREFAGPCEGSPVCLHENKLSLIECDTCSLVPRVAALLAEVTEPLIEEADKCSKWGYNRQEEAQQAYGKLAEERARFDRINGSSRLEIDSLKAENQRLAGELAEAEHRESIQRGQKKRAEAKESANAAALRVAGQRLTHAVSALDFIKETCEHVLKCKQCYLEADRVLSVVKAGLPHPPDEGEEKP